MASDQTDTTAPAKPLPFDELASAIQARRSVYGHISGLRLDRFAAGEAWSSLPYQPAFIGNADTGVIHGGVVTAMLDETCGMAVQLALDGTRSIATLDLRLDYLKAAEPGVEIKAHAVCYGTSRSIAFVRATAYQSAESDPVATATACFMIGANRTNMLERSLDYPSTLQLDVPDNAHGLLAKSPFARCLGIDVGENGEIRMPFSSRIVGNPLLPAIHGGIIGAFLETAAVLEVARGLDAVALPKPIGLTMNYLRSGRPLDSFAKVSIVKQGRRIVAFEAQAWQDDPTKPIASAFGHFMLRQSRDD
jgi:uncharacterized protein (TIGR00369 family)